MKRVIITGASGMIGGLVLQKCLSRPDVSQVTSIVRRSSGIVHSKLIEIIHADFLDYSSIENHFKNQDICFFCIGVYTGQVSKEEFVKITVGYTKAFAETLKRFSPNVTFCFLSGDGADQSEKSRVLFAREKGIAENILLGLKFGATYIFRPGYIYPVTPRQEPNFSYKVFRVLYKYLFQFVLPSIGITSEKLVAAMEDIGMNGGTQVIYKNTDLRKYKVG
ncbi:MAG: NAD(P)H-binding protein [Bacteroidota bacterium]